MGISYEDRGVPEKQPGWPVGSVFFKEVVSGMQRVHVREERKKGEGGREGRRAREGGGGGGGMEREES